MIVLTPLIKSPYKTNKWLNDNTSIIIFFLKFLEFFKGLFYMIRSILFERTFKKMRCIVIRPFVTQLEKFFKFWTLHINLFCFPSAHKEPL